MKRRHWEKMYDETKLKPKCEKYISDIMRIWYPDVKIEKIQPFEKHCYGTLRMVENFELQASVYIEVDKIWPNGLDDYTHIIYRIAPFTIGVVSSMEEIPAGAVRVRVKEVLKRLHINTIEQLWLYVRKLPDETNFRIYRNKEGKETLMLDIHAMRGSHSLYDCFSRMILIRDADKVIQKVAKRFDFKVIDVEKDPSYIEKSGRNKKDYTDHSICCGDEIVLGIYKNKELRLISFFHELGHTIVKQSFAQDVHYNKMVVENQCWQEGIRYAATHCGIKFSDEAIVWGYEQALTYVNYK
jgi:hypothetical protein